MDTGLDAVNTASKNVVNKVGEFIGNKIEDAVTKSNDDKPDETPRNVEEIIIRPEKRDEMLNKLRKAL